MKKIIYILCLLPSLLFAKEDLQTLRSNLKLKIAQERMKFIKADGDATNLYNRILREYKNLDEALKNHPKIKDSKLSDKELTILKLKLLETDEDLNDFRQRAIKLHRSLEDLIKKNPILKKLYTELDRLENKIEK